MSDTTTKERREPAQHTLAEVQLVKCMACSMRYDAEKNPCCPACMESADKERHKRRDTPARVRYCNVYLHE